MATGTLKDKGIPYICTPLTGRNREEILKELKAILLMQPDLIEWRADFLEEIHNTQLVLSIAENLSAVSNLPLLFTIRSEKEGGEKVPLTEEEKVHLLTEVCQSSAVDMVDYEVSNNPEHIKRLRKVSGDNNKKLILSYHNFIQTPENSEILKHLFKAEFYGADIAKAAVMPENKSDVLRLLEVTKQADEALSIPQVTMSMGSIGSLSRIVGWAYGSIITFGAGVKSSAPGQLPVDKLKKMIEMTQESIGEWK